MAIEILKSVGCVIEAETIMVYPYHYDPKLRYKNEGRHLEDCTDEWWESLSTKDRMTVAYVWGNRPSPAVTYEIVNGKKIYKIER
jgi:hypothetical protein